MEFTAFWVTMTTRIPDGTPPEAVGDVRAREAAPSRELAPRGYPRRSRR
ncbi:muconolactone Delta-isomerase family protein [Mycobacterium sp.]|nr:muconolactone Delta-isomerase family protein [Mycobacterium sp.]